MRLSQLTLYDFLADFLPGAIALVLIAGLLWLFGFVGGSVTTGMSLVLVVTGYPVGRSVHALAGQAEIKTARKKTFDALALAVGQLRSDTGLTDINWERSELTVTNRLESGPTNGDSDKLSPNEWIDRTVEQAFTGTDTGGGELTSSDAVATLADADIDWDAEGSLGQLQRFGFSELFDRSTLYQRYNILETFYRNLWLVFTYFSVLYFAITIALVYSLPISGPISLLPNYSPLGWMIVSAIFFLGVTVCFALVNPDRSLRLLRVLWYLLLGVVTGLIGVGVPVGLLLTRTPRSPLPDPTLSAVVGLGLLVLAVLFSVRRLQFKRRQVRAFMNDLYRQQYAADDPDT